MCIVVCISSFPTWGKCNDVYVEQVNATNNHFRENFQTACRWLRNDGYIERRSAINALIRVKIFKLFAMWDMVT